MVKMTKQTVFFAVSARILIDPKRETQHQAVVSLTRQVPTYQIVSRSKASYHRPGTAGRKHKWGTSLHLPTAFYQQSEFEWEVSGNTW